MAQRSPESGRRGRARRTRLFGVERPFLVALVALLAALTAMTLGPLESYSAAADRVDDLVATRDQLLGEVEQLEQRRDALSDPHEIELLARRDHGLVKPGDLPFVVVTPEPELAVGPSAADQEHIEGPWYRRLGRELTALFR